ncbi:MAG: polyprenol monophosphomannose synthase [bacterium]
MEPTTQAAAEWKSGMGTAFILIAAYNELENLKILLPLLMRLPDNYSILIVDDNSPDGSGVWLREFRTRNPRIHLVERPGKLGYGSAIIAGFRYVADKGAQVVVTMDADLSHDPVAVPHLVKTLDRADVVVGSRYKGGCRVLNWALKRLFVSVLANLYVKTLLRMPYADCTSGFRAYRVSSLLADANLDKVKSNGYSVLVELLYRLHRKGNRVVEYPIVFSERREGQSKMSGRVMLEAAINPFVFWLKIGLPFSPSRKQRGRERGFAMLPTSSSHEEPGAEQQAAQGDGKRVKSGFLNFIARYGYSIIVLFIFVIFFSIYYSLSGVFPRIGWKFEWKNLSHTLSPLTIWDNEQGQELNIMDEYISYTLGDSLHFAWRMITRSEGRKANFLDIDEIVHGWKNPEKIYLFKSWEFSPALTKAGYKLSAVGQIKKRHDVDDFRSIVSSSDGTVLILFLNGGSPTNLTPEQQSSIALAGFAGFQNIKYGEAYAGVARDTDGKVLLISEKISPHLAEMKLNIEPWGEVEIRSSLSGIFPEELKDKPSMIKTGSERTYVGGRGEGLYLLVLPSNGKKPRGYYLDVQTPYYVAQKIAANDK